MPVYLKYISGKEYLLNMTEEILNKKLKMEIKFAHTLLKETEELFSVYNDLFSQDFQQEINFKAQAPSPVDLPDLEEKISDKEEIFEVAERKDRDPELYKIYKKIAMKTHPDKSKDDSSVDIFNEATDAINNNDWLVLLDIAQRLKIKTPKLTKELRQKIQSNVVETNKKIKRLQNTTAWIWANAPEKDKERIKAHIRSIMGINEEEFQEHLKSSQE